MTERDILYKVLFDMKKDVADLKKVVLQVIKSDSKPDKEEINDQVFERLYGDDKKNNSIEHRLELAQFNEQKTEKKSSSNFIEDVSHYEKAENTESREDYHEILVEEEESLSISETEKKLIKKALAKHSGKRKYAAEDLGISERTLYRKIKEYDIEQ
jgi:DNA-binding NtrC family response regulator